MGIFSVVAFQLCVALLATAAPVPASTNHDNILIHATSGSILGLILLFIDVIVFVEVARSNRSVLSKLLWCLVVFLFPIFGMLIYWLFANRAYHNRAPGYEQLS